MLCEKFNNRKYSSPTKVNKKFIVTLFFNIGAFVVDKYRLRVADVLMLFCPVDVVAVFGF